MPVARQVSTPRNELARALAAAKQTPLFPGRTRSATTLAARNAELQVLACSVPALPEGRSCGVLFKLPSNGAPDSAEGLLT